MNLSLNTCFCIQIIFIVCANCSSAFDLLEFIFGPRLGNSQRVSAKSLDVPSAVSVLNFFSFIYQSIICFKFSFRTVLLIELVNELIDINF